MSLFSPLATRYLSRNGTERSGTTPQTLYNVRGTAEGIWLGAQLRADWTSRLGRDLRLGISNYFYHASGQQELSLSFPLSSLVSSIIRNLYIVGALSLPTVYRTVTLD